MTSEFSPAVTELNQTPESLPETAGSTPANPQTISEPTEVPLQVRFKAEGDKLLLVLPPTDNVGSHPFSWQELYQQLKQRLDAGERFWQPRTIVHLIGNDRLLDVRQLQAIAELLDTAELQLKRIYTNRRQTALAAATAGYSVEQESEVAQFVESPHGVGKALAEPLYLQTTVRSGAEIRHPGSLILIGDANPGSSLIAEGDILVWGRLRGIAHAGVAGNRNCRIMALHMQPTQLRIADVVARPPEKPPTEYLPEVAYIGADGMRIAIAAEFARSQIPGFPS